MDKMERLVNDIAADYQHATDSKEIDMEIVCEVIASYDNELLDAIIEKLEEKGLTIVK